MLLSTCQISTFRILKKQYTDVRSFILQARPGNSQETECFENCFCSRMFTRKCSSAASKLEKTNVNDNLIGVQTNLEKQ